MHLYTFLVVLLAFGWNGVHSVLLRNLSDSPSALIIAPVYQGDAQFYVDLHCGTPPQKQTVMINTDAPATVVPCTGCADCGIQHTLFNKDGSMSFEQSRCTSPESCWEGETCAKSSGTSFCTAGRHYSRHDHWYGRQVTDFCFVGSETAVIRTEFACQTSSSGGFRSQYPDGTLSLNRASPQSFIAQLYKAGKITKQEFSLCLRPSAQERSSEAGALIFGGKDSRFHSTPMVYTEMEGEHHYAVHIRKLHLKTNERRTLKLAEVTLNDGTVVIESGFAHSHFSGAINVAFRTVWKELTGNDFNDQPRYITYNQVAKLPTIVIQLAGTEKNTVPSSMLANDPDHPTDVLIEITPQQYMEFNDQTGEYVNKFELSSPKTKRTVLGADSLRGYDVSFDSTNRRIGWAESRCVLDENGIPMPDSKKEEEHTTPESQMCGSACQSFGFVMIAMTLGAMLMTKVSLKKIMFHSHMYRVAPTETMEVELNSVEPSFHYEQPTLANSGESNP
ncbi:hypothetical protein FisN_16Lh235 [Fistulifera solaris]|uniref:Peptidase A1 domain-containing protein n=1 Tax=Fistulifera solaris TaxID=1519565 RepID=A0A1Z5J6L0_FISSO|nr:hypothetical protein FisN_16Lh235 [Fistulifera solaris]|eukprot:GAX09542.1 hypothetical protein FisN_16Lh235 [Fistulifera solaris]